MNGNYLVTIFVPIFNCSKFADELMDCLLNQTYKNLEIILVDDFSTDNSYEILNNFATKDSRIKLIKRNVKGGTAVKGIEYAIPYMTGDYYFFLSQDDLIDYDCIEKCLKKAVESKAQVVLANMIWFYGDKNAPKAFDYPLNNDYNSTLDNRTAFLLSLTWKIHSYALTEMNFFKSFNLRADYYNSDEYYSRLRFLKCNYVAFANTNFYYRQNNSDAITKKIKYFDVDYLTIDIMLLDLLVENNYERNIIRKRLLDLCFKYYSYKKYLKYTFEKTQLDYIKNSLNVSSKKLKAISKKTNNYDILFSMRSYFTLRIIRKIFSLIK